MRDDHVLYNPPFKTQNSVAFSTFVHHHSCHFKISPIHLSTHLSSSPCSNPWQQAVCSLALPTHLLRTVHRTEPHCHLCGFGHSALPFQSCSILWHVSAIRPLSWLNNTLLCGQHVLTYPSCDRRLRRLYFLPSMNNAAVKSHTCADICSDFSRYA